MSRILRPVTIGFVEESIEVAERGEATLFVTIMDGTPQSGEVYVVTLTTSDGTADGTCVLN